jgi:hypothetical protein
MSVVAMVAAIEPPPAVTPKLTRTPGSGFPAPSLMTTAGLESTAWPTVPSCTCADAG